MTSVSEEHIFSHTQITSLPSSYVKDFKKENVKVKLLRKKQFYLKGNDTITA